MCYVCIVWLTLSVFLYILESAIVGNRRLTLRSGKKAMKRDESTATVTPTEWEAAIDAALSRLNHLIAVGPTKSVRETWRYPQHQFGKDAAYDITSKRLAAVKERRRLILGE